MLDDYNCNIIFCSDLVDVFMTFNVTIFVSLFMNCRLSVYTFIFIELNIFIYLLRQKFRLLFSGFEEISRKYSKN